MKLFTLMITLACISAVSTLQSQDINALMKGSKVVGGGISVSFSDDDFEPDAFDPDQIQTSDFTSFSFRPYAGKFIKDRLLLGGRLLITASDQESTIRDGIFSSVNESDEFNIGLGVFLRKYYPIAGKFGAFVETGVDFRTLNSDSKRSSFNDQNPTTEFSTERDGSLVTADIDLGLYVFLGERFSLETSLGRLAFIQSWEDITRRDLFQDTTNESSTERSNFNINFINQISFDQLITVNYFF